MNIKIEKRSNLENDIIFVDGIWGSGKSLLGPIVSTMNDVEWYCSDSTFEYVCWLNKMKKMSNDAAIFMLQTRCDTLSHWTTIGREINLRWSDDTGLKNIPNKFSRISRLWRKDDERILPNINSSNTALCIMPHMLALAPDLLFEAFQNRIKLIEVVRHPLHLIQHVRSYLERFENAREHTPSFYHNGIKIPWLLAGQADLFCKANLFEKAIIFICVAFQKLRNEIKNMVDLKIKHLVVSFESIVFETQKVIEDVEKFLSRIRSPNINKILKNQALPREVSFGGHGKKRYGWRKLNISEQTYHINLQSEVRKNCSPEVLGELAILIDWYNVEFPSIHNEFDKEKLCS
jgi:hypothetical protein